MTTFFKVRPSSALDLGATIARAEDRPPADDPPQTQTYAPTSTYFPGLGYLPNWTPSPSPSPTPPPPPNISGGYPTLPLPTFIPDPRAPAGWNIPTFNPALIPQGGAPTFNPSVDPQTVPRVYSPQDAINDAADLWNAANAPAQAEMDYANLQRSLELQEQELRAAMLDGDLVRAKQLLADIEANKAALARSYASYQATVNPYFDQRVTANQAAGAVAQESLGEVAAESAGEQSAIAGQAAAGTSDFNAIIGNSEAGTAAAQGLTAVGLSEYADYLAGQNEAAKRIAGATTDASVLGAEGDRAFILHELANNEKRAMAGFTDMADQAAQSITDIQMRRKIFDLQRQQGDLAHQKAIEAIQGKSVSMDSITFGRMTAEQWFLNRAEAIGIADDRQGILLAHFQEAFEAGVFSGSEYATWLGMEQQISDDLTITRAQQLADLWAVPMTAEEQQLLTQMFNSYAEGRDSWANGTVQQGASSLGYTTGRGYGVSYETEQNKQLGRGASDPSAGAYYERQQFAADLGNFLRVQFGVTRVGQWRSTDVACGGTTGRSCTSDHYSGGALDLHGPTASLTAAAEYLRNHPAVAFVKFQTPDGHHDDHVHVSFDLAYFGITSETGSIHEDQHSVQGGGAGGGVANIVVPQ